MGSEGLMEATSKAGVWPNIDPAASSMAALTDLKKLVDMVVCLTVRTLSDTGVWDCNPAAGAGKLAL
jgi:hypothetical protein